MSNPPFTRTVCACTACTQCCKRQPGPLAAGDYERIQAYLGISDEAMTKLFCASPGALVMNQLSGVVRRIGTITPQKRKGQCVFLDENDRCKIHAVAPFGCAYFDTHMSAATAQPRSVWLAHTQETEEYQALRNKLPYATHKVKPSRY
jgi:Fe-S-cluster containining protein